MWNSNWEGLEELKGKFPLLDKLYEERIFGLGKDEETGNVYIFEACDAYFGQNLSEKDCLELSEFFKVLSKYAKETK
ncbi:hypothetical protein [Bacillus sp. T33-2]|uniref:hypothetical protein n=1 Tax=Bacillus sp. T33-2 TaxID=2054168 RepID=UPI000C761523|nr:hypothetical protein [Bacillus sp. T33-2]PLR99594.1 hypothetical protein CVD19_00595 [Bacillus sp. T33-2]